MYDALFRPSLPGGLLYFERQSRDELGEDPHGEGAVGPDTDFRGGHRGEEEAPPGYLQPRQGGRLFVLSALLLS